MATSIDVTRIESTISYTFRDTALLIEALITPHKNELEEGGVETREGNRRLSALGEAVMRLFITQEWYRGVQNKCEPYYSDTKLEKALIVQLHFRTCSSMLCRTFGSLILQPKLESEAVY